MDVSTLGDLADLLEKNTLSGADAESLDRLVCARHYYHIFHVVSDWLSKDFNDIYICAGGGTHQAVRTACDLLASEYNDKDFKMLALKLKQLHDLRVHADYRIKEDFSKNKVVLMKAEKTRAINLIEKLSKTHK